MRLIAIGIVATVTAIASADYNPGTLTQWDFNGPSATTVPGGALSPSTSLGFGTASLIGGTTATFASGTANGGSTDPVTTTPPNYGWNVTTFAAQGQENNQRGVQFDVSTVGWDKIVVSWDQRHSNTSSRFVQFLYSLDGVNYTNAGLANDGIFEGPAGDTWFNNRAVDLSNIAGAADNANFSFRIVATFGPAGGYVASNTGSNYQGTGTWRFDMVTVSGNFIPAPGAIALLGLAGLVARRRR
ncbi:MAG: hypothetical protein KF724_02910 [Phycisphaeraceae bacterium]|nr:hypothetical protein [Phycisphaeraceae bacterium]